MQGFKHLVMLSYKNLDNKFTNSYIFSVAILIIKQLHMCIYLIIIIISSNFYNQFYIGKPFNIA